MDRKVEKIFTDRINKFVDQIHKWILVDSIDFTASYQKSSDPIPFGNLMDNSFQKIQKGEKWGEAWENAWFHLIGKIPESWSGKKVVAKLNFTGEGLIFDSEGNPKQGITSSSVYNHEFVRDIFTIEESCSGGENIELWIEVTAVGYLGINLPLNPEPTDPQIDGEFNCKVSEASYAILNEDLWQLWLDLSVLNELIQSLPKNDVRRSRIISNVNSAIDAFKGDVSNANIAREIIKESFDQSATQSDLSALAVGHAHIDTAWLWPVSETIRKIGRTFANQVSLLEKYPEIFLVLLSLNITNLPKSIIPIYLRRLKSS